MPQSTSHWSVLQSRLKMQQRGGDTGPLVVGDIFSVLIRVQLVPQMDHSHVHIVLLHAVKVRKGFETRLDCRVHA